MNMPRRMTPTMMAYPLGTSIILRHGLRLYRDRTIFEYDGRRLQPRSYGAVADGAARLATALKRLGVGRNDRVATFCWNHVPHFQAYFAVPGIGAVLHTLNIRLSPDQLRYIIRDAEDRLLIADASLLPLLRGVIEDCPTLEGILVVGGEAAGLPFPVPVHDFASMIESAEPIQEWPVPDENEAAVLCYTSGTTGNPKGVVYSHRTIFLHSLASLGAGTFALTEADRILLVPPMFHANAWGLPYSGWLAGSGFVLPGPHGKAVDIAAMMRLGCPTFSAMVPTIINDLLALHAMQPVPMESLRVLVSGGSAVSRALIERVRAVWGVPVLQGWGMTETSPLCALSTPPAEAGDNEALDFRAKSGRPVPGIEVRIVDDLGAAVAENGEQVGELQLRGPWVASGYHGVQGVDGPLSPDGWLQTGDVGTIDSAGFVVITDRAKDIIKSGGEWISSTELESVLQAHESVAEAAVIGIPDPRWEERPLAIIVPRTASSVNFQDLAGFLSGRVARLAIPDCWATVGDLPRTSVGKVDKRGLRQMVAEGVLVPERTMRP
jgi:fatty-acyl-CoA synthase